MGTLHDRKELEKSGTLLVEGDDDLSIAVIVITERHFGVDLRPTLKKCILHHPLRWFPIPMAIIEV